MPAILRLNLNTLTSMSTELTGNNRILGGRALTSGLVACEVPVECDPLGPANKLVFACGPLAATPVSSSSRLSVGAKSPLTGGLKESNAGGTTAYMMGRMDLRAVVFEGCISAEHGWMIVYISSKGVVFHPANDLCGLGVYEKAQRLRKCYGEHVGLSLIGVAGERCLASAGITNCDMDGEPSRYNGRGGLGAVMGSKRIHAVVIDPEGATAESYADKPTFLQLYKGVAKHLHANTAIYRKYGTAAVLDVTSNLGALPTRNFSAGVYEHRESINGVALYDMITERGGEGRTSHACMPGCLVQCSNVFPDATGKKLCSPIEYENLGMLGSNLGIGSLDAIAELNRLCNDLGCDTIEIGAALGVFMEQGGCAFGDATAALDVLRELFAGGETGLLIASGAVAVGQAMGSQRIPVANGQAFAAYDPRSMKGMGVTYATTSQGADHTAGSTLRSNVAQTNIDGQIEASYAAQQWSMVVDMLGVCLFMPGGLADRDVLAQLVAARWGVPIELEQLMKESRRVLCMEWAFNRAAGLVGADMPAFMRNERNPDSGQVFDIPDASLQELVQQLLHPEDSQQEGFFDYAACQ